MKTLSSIESLTGGLFASTITSIPGASKYFKGTIVTYQNEIKEKLGIDTTRGVINREVALSMSRIGRKFFNSDICVSFTGNAGPDGMDNKPVGLVFIAINEEVFELNFKGSRNEIRRKAVEFAIKNTNLS